MELNSFETDVLPLRERMLIVAQKLLADDEEAEDAVQEALIRLWQARNTLATHPNVGGYAMQSLKNTCLNNIKARKRNISIDDIQLSNGSSTPYTETEQSNSVDLVKQIIETLPTLQQLIITMRDVEEYELKEIAKIAGSNIAAVKVNLSRARKKVRDEFIHIQSLKSKVR